jgi:hypothetical protein
MEIELSPHSSIIKSPGDDEGAIETLMGKKNRVRLGAPRSNDWLVELSDAVPEDVRREVEKGYSFRRVSPSLTLLPDRGCIFLDVDLSLELLSDPPESGRPLAYDVTPHEVLHSVQFKESATTRIEAGGEGNIPFAKLLAKFVDENTVEREGAHYHRERYGYGLNYSEVGWRLLAGGKLPLEGDVSELAVVAKIPPHSELSGRFRIAAQIAVETTVDRWLTRSFGPRPDSHVLDVVYPLTL